MDCNTATQEKQDKYRYTSDYDGLAIYLRDEAGYLIMPEAILKSVGALGARLMGAIMDERRPSQPEFFKPVEAIAEMSFLGIPATRKLLTRLSESGWLDYKGRERPSLKRRCRRTATWVVTTKAWKARRPWYPWPKWLGEKPVCPYFSGLPCHLWSDSRSMVSNRARRRGLRFIGGPRVYDNYGTKR